MTAVTTPHFELYRGWIVFVTENPFDFPYMARILGAKYGDNMTPVFKNRHEDLYFWAMTADKARALAVDAIDKKLGGDQTCHEK